MMKHVHISSIFQKFPYENNVTGKEVYFRTYHGNQKEKENEKNGKMDTI